VNAAETGTTRATAHLPGLDIEIMHWRAVEGHAEQISINLRAVPSFEAFGRALETANPFAFWAHAAQLAPNCPRPRVYWAIGPLDSHRIKCCSSETNSVGAVADLSAIFFAKSGVPPR
jgi:hypothetical protein